MKIKLNLYSLDSVELKFSDKIPIYSINNNYLFDGILSENDVEIDEKTIVLTKEEQDKLKALIEKHLVYCSVFGTPTFELERLVKIDVKGLNLISEESLQLI